MRVYDHILESMAELLSEPEEKRRQNFLQILQTDYVGRLNSVAALRCVNELFQCEKQLSEWCVASSTAIMEWVNCYLESASYGYVREQDIENVFKLVQRLYEASEGIISFGSTSNEGNKVMVITPLDSALCSFEVALKPDTSVNDTKQVLFTIEDDEWNGILAKVLSPVGSMTGQTGWITIDKGDAYIIDTEYYLGDATVSYASYDALIHLTSVFQSKAVISKDQLLSILASFDGSNPVVRYVRDCTARLSTISRLGWASMIAGLETKTSVDSQGHFAKTDSLTVALLNLPFVIVSIVSTIITMVLSVVFKTIGFIVGGVLSIMTDLFRQATSIDLDSQVIDANVAENIIAITAGPQAIMTAAQVSAMTILAYQTDKYEYYYQQVRYVDFNEAYGIYLPFQIIYCVPVGDNKWAVSSFFRVPRCQSFEAAANSVRKLELDDYKGLDKWCIGCYNDAEDDKVPFQSSEQILSMLQTSVISVLNSLLRKMAPDLDEDFGGVDPYATNQDGWHYVLNKSSWYIADVYFVARYCADHPGILTWDNIIKIADFLTNKLEYSAYNFYKAMCKSRYNYQGVVASGRNYIAPIESIVPTILPPKVSKESLHLTLLGLGVLAIGSAVVVHAVKVNLAKPLSASAAKYHHVIRTIENKSTLTQEDIDTLYIANKKLSRIYKLADVIGLHSLQGTIIPQSPMTEVEFRFPKESKYNEIFDGNHESITPELLQDSSSTTIAEIKRLISG